MVERIYLLLEILTVLICIFSLFGEKFRLDIYTVLLIAVDIIILEAIGEGILSGSAGLTLYLMIFVYCILEFKSSLKLAVINNFLYIIVASVAQLLCSLPLTPLVHIVKNSELLILAINVLTLFVLFIVTRFVPFVKISDYVIAKDWLSILLTGLYIGVIILSIRKYRIDKIFTEDHYFLLIGFIILTAAFTVKWQESKNKIIRQQLELEMYEVYNQTFEELIHNIRRKQHDYKNQIVTIQGLMFTSKSYTEFTERFDEFFAYVQQDMEFNRLLKIKMPIVGGFLYSKFSIWKSEGIEITYELNSVVNAVETPVYEVIIIIGILLDNAYEAVKNNDCINSKIRFIMKDGDEQILFQIQNPWRYLCYEEFEQLFKEGYSSKGDGRGVGLFNARNKAQQYGMKIIVENVENENENWISFTLAVKKRAD